MGTDTTTNALFAPGLLLILQIVRSNIYLLETEVKVNDTDLFLTGELWVYMQLSPRNEYCSRAQYYRFVLPYVRRIISHFERDESHPFDYWNAGMKKYWRHGMSHNIGIITDYNSSIDNYK